MEYSTITAMIARQSGKTMTKNIFTLPQPSNIAASCISHGSDCMNVRITTILNTLTQPGMIIAQMVLSMPRPFTTRYEGIIPALTNMVSEK